MKRRHVIVALGLLFCCFGTPDFVYSAGLDGKLEKVREYFKKLEHTRSDVVVVGKAAATKSAGDHIYASDLLHACAISGERANHLQSLAMLYDVFATPGSDEYCPGFKKRCVMLAAIWAFRYRKEIQNELKHLDFISSHWEFPGGPAVALAVKGRVRELSDLWDIKAPAKQ